MPGWATRDKKYLCSCIRAKYEEMLKQAGFKLTTIETARDLARQKHYKKIGASRTLQSKHLLREDGTCLAFDITPSEYLPLKAWNPNGPYWGMLGKLGQSLGLEWGGSLWAPGFIDKPHFQLSKCECE